MSHVRGLPVLLAVLVVVLLGAPEPARASPEPPDADTGSYELRSAAWGDPKNLLTPMYQRYLVQHPTMVRSVRNIAVVQIDPTPDDPHYYHFVTSTINAFDKKNGFRAWFDVWADGVFVKSDLVGEGLMAQPPAGADPSTTNEFSPANKHSEQLLPQLLDVSRIDRERASTMLSSYAPCMSTSNRCRVRLETLLPNLREVVYFGEYTGARDPEDGEAQKKADDETTAREMAKRVAFEEGGGRMDSTKSPVLFSEAAARAAVRGSGAPSGGDTPAASAGPLPAALRRPGGAPGGIDFSSLELRYLAEPGEGFRYAFAGRAGPGPSQEVGRDVVDEQSDAFFVWLTLPPETFWVNLNPDEPDRVVDPALGRTDAGRILLEADLQLKRTVARLIHPDTPLGARFWRELDGAGRQRCLSFRQWIVPAPASVREDGDGVHIVDAPLSVQMESQRFAATGSGERYASCRGADERLERHNEEVFTRLVLPGVVQAVNTAPEYADLRRVYLGRVAAEWYRQRSAEQRTQYAELIDSGDTARWQSDRPWSPTEVFDRYVRSYTDGEFRVTRESRAGTAIRTDTYVFGGVDFSGVPFRPLGPDEFDRLQPDLAATVDRSLTEPAADRSGRLWLGSETALPGAPEESSMSAPDEWIWYGVGSGAILLWSYRVTRRSRHRVGERRRRRQSDRARRRQRARVEQRLRELAPPGRRGD